MYLLWINCAAIVFKKAWQSYSEGSMNRVFGNLSVHVLGPGTPGKALAYRCSITVRDWNRTFGPCFYLARFLFVLMPDGMWSPEE